MKKTRGKSGMGKHENINALYYLMVYVVSCLWKFHTELSIEENILSREGGYSWPMKINNREGIPGCD